MAIVIDYVSEGFSSGSGVKNGSSMLATSWDELLWSCLTVGRPNRQYVFKHGAASLHEALFRLSLLRMTLEVAGPTGKRLRRTSAAKTLDPTEKGAINYFLGLTVCKLFASRLLNTPWLLHLDVFRPLLNPVLTGRSRPDLVGEMVGGGKWISLECKGRLSPPDSKAKAKAKLQAQRLLSVGGVSPTHCVGGISFFKGDVLQFFWRDPDPNPRAGRPVRPPEPDQEWASYYALVLALYSAHRNTVAKALDRGSLVQVPSADLQVGVHPEVLKAIERKEWTAARRMAERVHGKEPNSIYRADGVAVRAGPSWNQPFDEALGPLVQG